MRASTVVERSGVASVSLVCQGFLGQAKAIAPGLGMLGLPLARIVGHVDGLTVAEIERDLLAVTLEEIEQGLTQAPQRVMEAVVLAPDAFAARGTEEEIRHTFEARAWSDGLPFVPPTRDRVATFLREASDAAERRIGVLMPAGAAATVLNVAVNGVMAGCRPEHMPVLVAIAEALCDPGYGVEHSGDTTGGDALVILSGPAILRLGFNYENAALRDGHLANSTVGRFLRLLLRNVARSLPGGADKATFGNSFRVVLAEHEAACAALGWQTYGADRGFSSDQSLVTVARFTSGGVVGSIYGRDGEEILRNLGDALVRHSSWELAFTVGFAPGTYRPLLVLSPMVARTLVRAGLSKEDVRAGLFRHARLPADKFETYIGLWSNLVAGRPTLRQLVDRGLADPVFAIDNDPRRLVPIVAKQEHIQIVVSGDPLRSNAYVLASNGMHGFPTSKEVRWPVTGRH